MNLTRICLIMFYDFMVKEYGDIVYNINKKYCEKNKIDVYNSTTILEANSLYNYKKENYFNNENELLENKYMFCFICRS